jgi:hypothetical protein
MDSEISNPVTLNPASIKGIVILPVPHPNSKIESPYCLAILSQNKISFSCLARVVELFSNRS